jgi:hypothetical protein
MNDIHIFYNPEFGEIRTAGKEDGYKIFPYFINGFLNGK